ncbi:actin cytoskeleton and mitosis protein [Gnomoniopsis smithogilvyi]|uniref:Actin cytoskeleton and mitosis protein n=1 Tax=Gnomoniopsis smithogilvyi TaxID=1191159 RepID=A0A9W8YN67_9PEZI|nr:actin cytoskeleton and mitosis protein [Gnomoniopsis smithogilvyi]
MSGFGGAPLFGAQVSDASGQTSSFGAPSTSSTSLFPHQATSNQHPTFGAPSIASQKPSTPSFSIFGHPDTPNAPTSTSSNSGGALGGFNISNKDATMSNPFAAAIAAPAGGASNPFSTQSQNATAVSNPFASLGSSSTTSPNPFGSAASSSPFASLPNATASTSTTFGQSTQQSNSVASPFATPTSNIQKRKNAFEDNADSKRPGATFATGFQKPQKSAVANTTTGFGGSGADKKTVNGFAGERKEMRTNGFNTATAAPVQGLDVTSQKKSPALYAQEIHDQLRKNNIKPPSWPSDPGDPDNMKAMDDYRVRYKAYESRVRSSLIKAGIIDDPDVRKKLSDAIDFRGVCEDMCPEGEKVSRIVEHDVKLPERIRNPGGPGDGWPNPDLMVKSFKRSAAGIDAPLPTEVRSPAALRRTVDYLIDDLLKGDENLPLLHGFLWDRTRAIRKDFIFQNAMTPEERIDQIYCLENITRFHAVSLQLLSKDGKSDFSEQQEREQLGKTLLSLIQVYDECKDMNIQIDNEAEFRSYFLLYNAFDPFVIQQMQDWSDRFWFDSPEIQTAVSLIELLQNVWHHKGPMKPWAPLTLGSQSFSSYFAIVESPEVSYTMACLAGIHFTELRRLMLKALHKSYARVRGNPKDLTAKVLNEMFRFDTEDECLAFLKEYGMEFSSEGTDEPYMIVERRRGLTRPTIKHSFSQKVIERKRGRHSLPEVVHTTVFEEMSTAVDKVDSSNGLFIAQHSNHPMVVDNTAGTVDMSFTDDESPSASPAPMRQGIAPPPTSSANSFPFSKEKVQTDIAAPPRNPFFPKPPHAATPAPPSTEKPPPAFPSANSPLAPSPSSSSVFPPPSMSQQPKGEMSSLFTSSTPAAAPVSTLGSGGVFNFLNKSAEQSQAHLFPGAVTASASVTSSLFPAISPLDNRDKHTESKSDIPTTKVLNNPESSQGVSTAPESIFATPAASTLAAAPFSFGQVKIPPTSSTLQSPKAATPPLLTSKPSSAPDPNRFSLPPAPAPPAPPPKPRDMMGDFTKWLVLGDQGLMEQLEEKLVEDIVRDTFENFQREERERQEREDDQKAVAEALAFRTYNLRLKYFYRWQHNAQRKFARKAAKKNRVLMKEWREARAAEARAVRVERDKEEKARQKRLTGPASWLDELDKDRSAKRARRESMSLDTSRRTSPAGSDADALLATGIFGGLPNQQDVAANCVRDDDSLYDALVGVQISPDTKRQVMGPPARPVKDPLRSVRDAGISKAAPKQQWSKKAQALKDLISGKKQDDDLLSFKGSTSSRLGQSVRSAPGSKVTNFSRYQSSSPRSSAEPDRPRKGSSGGVKSSYWLLRSRGLFATPAGHILSDKAPRPRSGSVFDHMSQYSGDSDNGDYDDRVLEQDSAYRASLGLTGGQSGIASRRSTFSLGAAGSPPRPGFMKSKASSLRQSLPAGGLSTPNLLDSRSQRGDADAASQAGSAVSTMQQDIEESLRELRKVAAAMEEETEWLREQNSRMSQGRDLGA